MQSTISALIRNREAGLRDLERKVLQHFGSLVAPAITRLKAGRLNASQRSWLDVLESNLRNMVLPTATCLATDACRLTPAEIRTANLVRRGHTAADIARRLNLSVRTVESHCYNIRKKLNLKNRRLNLKSFLQGSES